MYIACFLVELKRDTVGRLRIQCHFLFFCEVVYYYKQNLDFIVLKQSLTCWVSKWYSKRFIKVISCIINAVNLILKRSKKPNTHITSSIYLSIIWTTKFI